MRYQSDAAKETAAAISTHAFYKSSAIIIASLLVTSAISLILLNVAPTLTQAASPPAAASQVSWMTQVAALSGQPPKLNVPPLVQLDTGAKYYKTMIDGMMFNFKKAVGRASERSFSLNNVTSSKPINLVVGNAGQQQRVSIQDIQIEGLSNPKVSSVYVSKKNMKLHVTFLYKSVKVSGRCSVSASQGRAPTQVSPAAGSSKVLLEATNWNTSWSASVMQMIGREHFDLRRVHSSHRQQRISLNLKECPQSMHERLRAAILDRVQLTIDSRLIEIMETVMIHTDTLSDEAIAAAAAITTRAVSEPRERGKRASAELPSTKSKSAVSARRPNPIVAARSPRPSDVMTAPASAAKRGGSEALWGQSKQAKALKRTKRQTPCQQGEELDDYVDQLFRFGTRIVRAMEPITLPNATIELPDYNLKIFLYEGKGTRAYKFRRTKPAWVFCSNETISLGLTIEVEELRVAYKYRVISGTRLLFDGDLEAKLSPKVQAQFSQAVQEEDSDEPVQQRVDRVRVFRLGKVFVVIRGLGNLTQSLSMLINSYLNDNQEELQPTFRRVEGDAVRLINRLLANVNVPLLSVV